MKHISASSITTFRRCPRQWFLQYVEGRRSDSGPAAALGTAIHLEMENWYRHGFSPSTPNAKLALEHAPERHPAIQVEAKLRDMTIAGYPVKGRVDLMVEGLVVDWKTTGSGKTYAKTDADLPTDPQAVIYGEFHRGLYGKPPTVRLVYINTKRYGEPTWKAEYTFDDAGLDAGLAAISTTVADMKAAALVTDVSTLPCFCRGNCKICSWAFVCDKTNTEAP